MHTKTIYIALLALLVITIDAKKTKRGRRLKDDEESTPQPSVVSYSTFGFNDVGSYDGFVPSSPGYSTYLSSLNQENTGPTRLYAPAFPTAEDTTGPASSPGIQPLESYTIEGDNSQASVMQYQNFINQNNGNSDHEPRVGTEVTYSQNGDYAAPIYGTKLNTRARGKLQSHFNDTDDYGSGPSSPSDDKSSNFREPQPTKEVKSAAFGEVSTNYQNYYNYAPTYPPSNAEDYGKTEPVPTSNFLKFPKVIDFTKVKQFYPTAIDNKYSTATIGPANPFASLMNNQNNNYSPSGNDESSNYNSNISQKYNYKSNKNEEHDEKDVLKPNIRDTVTNHEINYYGNAKNKLKSKQPMEYKDQFKHRPWQPQNETEPKFSRNPFKGFEYSTDNSNASFKIDYDSSNKKPFGSEFGYNRKPSSSDFDSGRKPSNSNSKDEELVPASSNVIDFSNYPFHDNDFSTFKKFPKNSYSDEFEESIKNFNKQKPEELAEQYKNMFNAEPSVTTQQWGNIFKSADYSYKQFPKKPQITEVSDEIVHIPKRPHGQKFFTPENEWPYSNNYRPQKFRNPHEWNKDVSNRFKSEEDLLGLRTRDTSHPSYLPTYKPSQVSTDDAVLDDNDYKKLVEKWKQSYWRAKYKNTPYNEYEAYSSNTKTTHVPVPKPYAIEIPHPVIVPVPQPYPVRVPVPKPVAVPVIQELTVPVERPVPYPVYKNVPYPIEKLVPVPIEKKVPVPVVKPYPVAVPHVRPVFHHGKPPRDEYESDRNVDEDDYVPRPENTKKVPYVKRPSKRPQASRSRRPSRMSYQDRTRRRWPTNKQTPGSSRPQRNPEPHRPIPSRRPNPEYSRYPQRYHEHENEDYERESEYAAYCKRTGKC